MLSIRMQRLGRKGHPTYRVVVQDSRLSPTSGKYVALLGSYDPHTKKSSLTKDRAQFYLDHGAQPSDRVVRLFKAEKITLPKWVKEPTKQDRQIRNPEKLRRNRPAEEADASPKAESAEETSGEEVTVENQATENQATDEPAKEAPAEVKEEEDNSAKADEAVNEADQKSEETSAEKQETEPSKTEEDKKSDKKEETSK